MMEVLIFCIVFLLLFVGLLGSIFPIIPGPIFTFFGLLVLHFFTDCNITYNQLILYFLITVIVLFLDYLSQYFGVKKFGGKKNAVYGTIIGCLIGFFLPPFGLVIGPFLGAFLGSLIDKKDTVHALKIAFGSFIGFMFGTLIKIIYSMYVLIWVVWKLIYLL